jgi:hypothetical protein
MTPQQFTSWLSAEQALGLTIEKTDPRYSAGKKAAQANTQTLR